MNNKLSEIEEIKKILGIDNTDIAKFFGYKNMISYANATRKKKIENGIIKIFELTRQHFLMEKDFKEFNPEDHDLPPDPNFEELKRPE